MLGRSLTLLLEAVEYVDCIGSARHVDHPPLTQDMNTDFSCTGSHACKRLPVPRDQSPLNRIELKSRLAARLGRKVRRSSKLEPRNNRDFTDKEYIRTYMDAPAYSRRSLPESTLSDGMTGPEWGRGGVGRTPTAGKAQVREDLDHHLGIFDGGDDLQAAATARALFDVDIKYPLEQARPTHTRRR